MGDLADLHKTLSREARAAPFTKGEAYQLFGGLGEYSHKLAEAIQRLSARIAEIEEKGVVYRGGFNQSDEYKRGDLVSHGGSIFHCTRPTQGVRPTHGDEQKAFDHPWQLAVKRGRDAR